VTSIPDPYDNDGALQPYEAQRWAWSLRVGGPGRKATLTCLVSYADEIGTCFPGQALIAEATEQGERTVRRHLAELEEAGVLCRELRHRDDGRGRTSDRFRLHIRRCPVCHQPAIVAGWSSPSAAPATVASERSTGHCEPTNRPLTPDQPATVAGEVLGEGPDELPATENTNAPLATVADLDDDPLLGFDAFWDVYPRRNGKRLGRRLCEGLWARLPLADRRGAWRGARYYADAVGADLTIAKDPERFLRHRAWEDWQEPATPDPPRANGARPSNVEQSWAAIGRVFGDTPGGIE
jgi:hypothetical protein